eukprot:TRINITY_DN20965_c0_g1_i1.p1 TRINITY_DN20965_c0_g1~~TRINITY_DN20965_c0_g1_i1.p1  ORF type:complete len:445 (+),score=60.30 TRINITY_DN20965_c0_g1_i1:51-1385(+)
MRRMLIGVGAGVAGFGGAVWCDAKGGRRTEPVRGVVVGGGCAGAMLVLTMDHLMHVTLVDKKSYFEFTPVLKEFMLGQTKDGGIDKDWFRKYFIPHKYYINNGRLIIDDVVEITPDSVILKSGQKIPFDFCFVCTGSGSNIPWRGSTALTVSDRAQEMQKYNKLISSSEKITVIGGGATGVEHASVLVREHPGKQVNLVHSHQRLLPVHGAKSGHYTQRRLEEAGVKVTTMAKVTDVAYDNGKFTVKYTHADQDGGVIDERIIKEMEPVDFVMDCRGIKPATGCLRKNFSECLDDEGFVTVNEFNQLTGHPNIFALGDIAKQDSSLGKESGLAYVVDHVSTVSSMIRAIAANNTISEGNNLFNLGIPLQFIHLVDQYDHVGTAQLIGETRGYLATYLSRKLHSSYLLPLNDLRFKEPVPLEMNSNMRKWLDKNRPQKTEQTKSA